MRNNLEAQNKDKSNNPPFSEVFDFFCKSDLEITLVQTFYNKLSIQNVFPKNWKELASHWINLNNQENRKEE